MHKEQEIDLSDFRKNLDALQSANIPYSDKIFELGLLYNLLLEAITKSQPIRFTTLFSRIVYLKTMFTCSSKELFLLQVFRLIIEKKEKKYDKEQCLNICRQAFNILFSKLEADAVQYDHDFDVLILEEPRIGNKFSNSAAGIVYSEADQYFFIPEDKPDIFWQLNIKEQKITNQLERILEFQNYFVQVNLVNATFETDQKVVSPQVIVLMPNYLMDVTSIAECFKPDGQVPENFILKKFIRPQKSMPMVLGNAANQFLDALVYNINLDIKDLMVDLFQSDPLAFTQFTDQEITKFFQDSKKHFYNIKNVLLNQLRAVGIDVDNTYTEPSFLSNIYGLQGRLDVLHQTNQNKTNNIVELKSGSVYKPNAYNISKNHYTQTLLYDLMVNSSFGKGTNVSNYILYSKMDKEPLRFAPKAVAQQSLALILRNDLIYIELLLQNIDYDHFFERFQYILDSKGRGIDRFVSQRLSDFGLKISQLSEIECKYFRSFTAFVAREHAISKIGAHGIERSNGLASLWLDTIEEKQEQFSILSMLQIFDNQSASFDPHIVFKKSIKSNKLSKFRVGDIVVLYPASELMDSPLRNQVFKCTILEIGDLEVKLKFRNKQYNQTIFKEHEFWNIEPDFLDSGYLQMYRNLTHWMQLPEHTRLKLLGLKSPEVSETSESDFVINGLTIEQQSVLKKMIQAKDFFLLWGPPGTGKTSVMIRELVRHLSQNEKPILLLAYTNRAVDEICDAIASIGEGFSEAFIRVGSSHACHEKHKARLLSRLVLNCKSRKNLSALLESHKIYVSTISSILGKLELLKIKSFGTLIIDEASQVLEPTILGVMGWAEKVIMIGDHKQLPAVVRQSSNNLNVKFQALKDQIGLNTLDRSLFERLFKNFQTKGLTDNYGILSHQGRMHEKIMAFPSQHFYNNQLKVLSGISRLTDRVKSNDFIGYVKSKRVIFIDSAVDNNLTHKTNEHEALIVNKLVKLFMHTSAPENQTSDKYLGVITPFRAQIALIHSILEASNLNQSITVDTVERYQGSAREHIIYSMCMNRASQIVGSLSKEEEGVNRKFNVALTRAKESIILIGNSLLLSKNPIYMEWIKQAILLEESQLDDFISQLSNRF